MLAIPPSFRGVLLGSLTHSRASRSNVDCLIKITKTFLLIGQTRFRNSSLGKDLSRTLQQYLQQFQRLPRDSHFHARFAQFSRLARHLVSSKSPTDVCRRASMSYLGRASLVLFRQTRPRTCAEITLAP